MPLGSAVLRLVVQKTSGWHHEGLAWPVNITKFRGHTSSQDLSETCGACKTTGHFFFIYIYIFIFSVSFRKWVYSSVAHVDVAAIPRPPDSARYN